MYTRMFVCPWRGPTTKIRINDTMTTSVAKTTKPGGGKEKLYLVKCYETQRIQTNDRKEKRN
jgi:hypothetical protein